MAKKFGWSRLPLLLLVYAVTLSKAQLRPGSNVPIQSGDECVPPGQCLAESDLIFVMDVSDSIDRESLNQQIQTILAVIDQLYVNDVTGFRVGIVTFSSDVIDVIPFNLDVDFFRARLQSILHPREGTNTAAGLERMRQVFQQFGRQNTGKIAVLMTDGGSWDHQAALNQVNLARRENITIATVGVGCLVNTNELEQLSTQPSLNFKIDHYGLIQRMVSKLTTFLCPRPLESEISTTVLPTVDTLPTFTPLPESSTRQTGTPPPPPVEIPTRPPTPTPPPRTPPPTQPPIIFTPSPRTPPPFVTPPPTPRTPPPFVTPPPTPRTPPPFVTPPPTPRVVTSPSPRPVTPTGEFRRTTRDPNIPTVPLSLCDGCAIRNGVGYNPHPERCDWYIQCNFEGDTIVKVQEKECPLGLFWSQNDVTCTEAKYVDCPRDPCRVVRDGVIADVRDCRAFWTCREGFTFQANCCPENNGFVDGRCQAGTGCATNCTVAVVGQYPCNKRAHDTNRTMYYEDTFTLGRIERKCPPGVAFDNTTCDCSIRLPYVDSCKPELYLPFDGDFRDRANNNAVGVLGPTIADVDGAVGQAALFTGDDRLSIWRFSNAYFGDVMLIKFRFLPLARQDTSNLAEALITNSDCGKKATIEISLERNGQRVTGLIDTVDNGAQQTSITVRPDGWVDVTYLYNRTQLILEGKPAGGPEPLKLLGVSGNIRRNKCALQVSYGHGLANFTGYIDELYIYFCIPENF